MLPHSDISSQINKLVAELQERYGNMRPILSQVAAMIESAIDDNFDQGGRWDGSGTGLLSGGNQRWTPLSKATKANYRKLGYTLEPTLRRSGILRSSIEARPYGKSSIMISSNHEYAAIHQFGGQINHPGGTPYVIGKNGKAKFISKRKAAGLKSKGKNVLLTSAHTINIPARPYITLSEDDLKQIFNEMMLLADAKK